MLTLPVAEWISNAAAVVSRASGRGDTAGTTKRL